MKRYALIILLACLPFQASAGIPNFFSGLIGTNVKKYCDKGPDEKEEVMQSVNLYTGNHKVVVVCSEKVAEAETPASKPTTRAHRIAR
ncbi:MAG: hypothetical protein R3352_09525 [Salinisphaeraceae bacterium]|nr:hypothetical protein [Salinisphaeraceae bacterium]